MNRPIRPSPAPFASILAVVFVFLNTGVWAQTPPECTGTKIPCVDTCLYPKECRAYKKASAQECTGTKVFCVDKCLYPRECEDYKLGKLKQACREGACDPGLVCRRESCTTRAPIHTG